MAQVEYIKDGYTPIRKAMQGENNDGNGIISGYNCRHRAIVYKDGMTAPTEYSKAFIKSKGRLIAKDIMKGR